MTDLNNLIFYGILLFIIGFGIHCYDQTYKKHYLVNAFLWLSWISAATFTIHIFSLINTGKAQDAIALSPLGMMIAALIASASVMKNIAETKAHDLAKSEKEKIRKRAFALDTMIAINNNISIFIRKNNQYLLSDNLYFSRNKNLKFELTQTSEIIKTMIDKLFSEAILPYLNKEERELITFFHLQFYSFYMNYILSQKNTVISCNKKNYLRSYKNLYDHEDIFSMDKFNTLKHLTEQYIDLKIPIKD